MSSPLKTISKIKAEDVTPEELEAWKEEHRLEVTSDNLAIPEIHVGDTYKNEEPAEDVREKEAVSYDDLAVPEVHFSNKKK